MRVPFFSICIPQYNRTAFLLKALESITSQTFQDLEICISDGGSTDGGRREIEQCLRKSGRLYHYTSSQVNLPYDQNLRACISLSLGRYCLLLGNDDRLTSDTTLVDLMRALNDLGDIGAAITNYTELATGRFYPRAQITRDAGSGPAIAARSFRDYAFVSGLILNGQMCRSFATDCCDGSEMYQMYLGTRIVASGGRLVYINQTVIQKDIQLPGQHVDSYQHKTGRQIRNKPLPMARLAETVDKGLALSMVVGLQQRRALDLSILLQLYLYTYPFWIIEYKRVFGLLHAAWFNQAVSPARTANALPLGAKEYVAVWAVFSISSAAAWITPAWLFRYFRPWLYNFAKRFSGRALARE